MRPFLIGEVFIPFCPQLHILFKYLLSFEAKTKPKIQSEIKKETLVILFLRDRTPITFLYGIIIIVIGLLLKLK
jgi:hypothetical protein